MAQSILLDELVERYKDIPIVTTVFGIHLQDMGKEQLIAIIRWSEERLRLTKESHTREIDMLISLRK